jgi:hypothetical protein
MSTRSYDARRVGLLAAALLLTLSHLTTGCSFTDGEPWSSLRVSLSSQTSPDDLVGSPDVSLDASPAALNLELVRVTTTSGGGGGEFDPSDPPEGYTLCHNGHCHAESGELVSYEDVRAEMQSGGGTSESTLGTASTDIDFSAPISTTVGPLPIASQGAVSRVDIESPNVVLNGTIQRGGSSVPMVARLGPIEFGGVTLDGVNIGPDAPETRTLSLCATWSDPLFEDIDLEALEAQENQILITKIVNADAAQTIIDALKDANWTQSCN